MSDAMSALVRLFGPADLPVRIPDWPEGVGIAVCRNRGKTLSMQPYHVQETGQMLRRRLTDEVGEELHGFRVTPALKGIETAEISPVDDRRIAHELENALRSMPRLIETVQDFSINFAFALDEGLGLAGLADQARRKPDGAEVNSDNIPVGYQLFEKADSNSEVISGASLKPQGAAGVDLFLSGDPNKHSREIPAEPKVLVREDSLRVAIPLKGVLVEGKLPNVLRLPAGSILISGAAGKVVPALVLRRGNILYVTPEAPAVAAPLAPLKVAAAPASPLWKWLGLGVAGLIVIGAIGFAAFKLLSFDAPPAAVEQAPVNNLRSNLFAPVTPSGQ